MRKFTLQYDDQQLATVTIEDDHKALVVFKEMVEFWAGWHAALFAYDGDYAKCWLFQLANYIVRNNKLPSLGEEGWCALDGTFGFTVTFISAYEFDDDAFAIIDNARV